MARLRHAVAATLAVVPTLLATRAVIAQSCHFQPSQELSEPGWRLTLAQETAHFESSRYEGHYQGLLSGSGVTWRRLDLDAALAVYRIVRNGRPSRGTGDLAKPWARVRITTAALARWSRQ